jgi:thymidylate kinase
MINAPEYGKLFVFEGPDGSGKTTLSRAFVEYLKGEGVECDYLAFPGQEPNTIGKLIYDLHHDPTTVGVKTLTPTSLQLLHIASHVDAIETKILPSLKRGRSIVLDRFWWSTWVYGKVGGVHPKILRAMIQLEQMSWGKTQPVTVFLIDRMRSAGSCSTDHVRHLSTEYTKIADGEAQHYPVKYIKNDGTVPEALADIIHDLRANVQSVSTNGTNRHGYYQTQLPLNSDHVSVPTPIVFSKFAPAKPTVVFDTYWKFAAERQAIFFKRLTGTPPPWTRDPVLLEYKFTNAYRASDRVSQYLIKHVIYNGDQSPEEIFFRILLFKFFNKIETWEMLANEAGTISFADYSFERYDAILNRAIAKGVRIYSAAYIMPSGGPSSISTRKHRMHLKLLEQMMHDEMPAQMVDAPSMRRAFELLLSYQSIGDFLAYQFVTDLNYSPLLNFSEMDFVVPGPGARDGIRKCFTDLGGLNESEIIRVVADRQQAEFEQLGIPFQSLWGRPLQLIDCQNLFCEVDKYARVKHPEVVGITGRTRIKQRYRINRDPVSVWYPPKWGLNERIVSKETYVSSI